MPPLEGALHGNAAGHLAVQAFNAFRVEHDSDAKCGWSGSREVRNVPLQVVEPRVFAPCGHLEQGSELRRGSAQEPRRKTHPSKLDEEVRRE